MTVLATKSNVSSYYTAHYITGLLILLFYNVVAGCCEVQSIILNLRHWYVLDVELYFCSDLKLKLFNT